MLKILKMEYLQDGSKREISIEKGVWGRVTVTCIQIIAKIWKLFNGIIFFSYSHIIYYIITLILVQKCSRKIGESIGSYVGVCSWLVYHFGEVTFFCLFFICRNKSLIIIISICSNNRKEMGGAFNTMSCVKKIRTAFNFFSYLDIYLCSDESLNNVVLRSALLFVTSFCPF